MNALLPAICILFCIGPGAFVARRLPVSPVERLILVPGISVVLAYLLAMLLFVAGAARFYPLALAGMAGCGVLAIPSLIRACRPAPARSLIGPLVFVSTYLFAAACAERVFGGGSWASDWLEHLQRAHYFAGHLPDDYLFLGSYPLPARPPLQNVIVALLLSVGATDIITIQVAGWLFACVMLLPLLAMVRLLRPTARRGIWSVAPLLLGSSALLAHALFPWTRCLSAYFVLASTYVYLRSMGGARRGTRLAIALCLMSAAFLTHYSAGPYAVAMLAHAAATRAQRRALALPAALAALLLATWFALSASRFGLAATLGSNTAVSDASSLTAAGNLRKIAGNFLTSLVPFPLRTSPARFREMFGQASAAGYLRDYAFTIYVCCLPGALGPLMGIPVIAALRRSLPAIRSRAVRLFWVTAIPVIVILGIAVHGAPAQYGVAHICLFPLELIALAFLASVLPTLARWKRVAILSGAALDFALGPALNLWVLSAPVRPGETYPYSFFAHLNFAPLRAIGSPLLADLVPGIARPAILGLAAVMFCASLAASARSANPRL